MNPLGNDSVANLLVDLNANGTLSDVPDTASATMVELMGHTLVNGTINLDVNILTDVESTKVSRDRDNTLSPEGSCEEIPCSCP